MKSKIDFQLHEVLPDGRVTGRNCGADAPIGTVFTALGCRDFPATEPGEDIISPALVFVCDVSLRLDAVEMYGHHIDFVGSGLTAMLSLSGRGLPEVTQFLSTAPDRTYYSLCALDDHIGDVS